jgi:nuclear inhibitor of protein phosphatase 1
MLGISEDSISKKNANKNKRKSRNVHFNEDEIVINPEDVDPSVGRFRNLVQTTVIPSASASKKIKLDLGISAQSHHHTPSASGTSDMAKNLHPISLINLYQGLNPPSDSNKEEGDVSNLSLGSKLGLLLPNPAPDVTPVQEKLPSRPTFKKPSPMTKLDAEREVSMNEPKKKKYAKEAWPGR